MRGETPALVLRVSVPLDERQTAALERALAEELIKIPLLVAEATIEKRGNSEAITIEFETPRGFTVVVDPED